MVRRVADWIRSVATPERQVAGAVWLLVISMVAWPLTSLTVFSREPQGVLALSWIAIQLTALNIVVTVDVRRKQKANGG